MKKFVFIFLITGLFTLTGCSLNQPQEKLLPQEQSSISSSEVYKQRTVTKGKFVNQSEGYVLDGLPEWKVIRNREDYVVVQPDSSDELKTILIEVEATDASSLREWIDSQNWPMPKDTFDYKTLTDKRTYAEDKTTGTIYFFHDGKIYTISNGIGMERRIFSDQFMKDFLSRFQFESSTSSDTSSPLSALLDQVQLGESGHEYARMTNIRIVSDAEAGFNPSSFIVTYTE